MDECSTCVRCLHLGSIYTYLLLLIIITHKYHTRSARTACVNAIYVYECCTYMIKIQWRASALFAALLSVIRHSHPLYIMAWVCLLNEYCLMINRLWLQTTYPRDAYIDFMLSSSATINTRLILIILWSPTPPKTLHYNVPSTTGFAAIYINT